MELALARPDLSYKSASQVARLSTEKWAAANLYCASCGGGLSAYPANHPVSDFHSEECGEEFQLKAKKSHFGATVLDSEYHMAKESVLRDEYPSLILLHYDLGDWAVMDVDLVHRACITTSRLIQRRPLGAMARRAGWTGCNISLEDVPEIGRINVVRGGKARPLEEVMSQWKQSDRLLKIRPATRGWTADVLACVEQLGHRFRLDEVYSFEGKLSAMHPENKNVRPKVRQQLQILRDLGIVEFVTPGVYSRVP